MVVEREGRATRTGLQELDEIEIFMGDENSLRMQQTYTHEFQCIYDLTMYPFDNQVTNQNETNVDICPPIFLPPGVFH